MTRILLKARPTPAQLRDRLAAPRPQGLELYLDRADLDDPGLERARAAIARADVPADFTWIVEAPIRTLGGRFFDLAADDVDARETLRRVVAVGADVGAVAANVHVVAPTHDAADLTPAARARKLDECRGLLGYYVEICDSAGLVPQVENVPPVGRMREGAFVFSPIGAAVDDLWALAETFPSLGFTVDVSHAALALNWGRADPETLDPALAAVARFVRSRGGPPDLTSFVAALADRTTTVHVSNAAGLLGEGLAYSAGAEDLDGVLAPLFGQVRFLVTETLEANDANAVGMREVQRRLSELRGAAARVAGGSG